MTRPDDWWPEADRDQGWRELPSILRRGIKRYNPQAGVIADGALFDAWQSIPFSRIRAGDIFQVFDQHGSRIDDQGNPLPAHLAFVAHTDARKAIEHGRGYEVLTDLVELTD